MRRAALVSLGLVLITGCASPEVAPAPPASSTGQTSVALKPVDPDRITRVRADLPDGYEVAAADGVAVPITLWGLPAGSTADPDQCLRIVDPAGAVDAHAAHGLSGSGPGGILYVSVVGTAPGAAVVDPALRDDCPQWTVTGAHSSAQVQFVDAPQVPSADTIGLTATVRTVVESGTETDASAQAFIAYLGDFYVFVTLVTDPGAVSPPLAPDVAADLLVRTVAVLRG